MRSTGLFRTISALMVAVVVATAAPRRLLSTANAALVYVAVRRAANECCSGVSQVDADDAWTAAVNELRSVARGK